MALSNGITPDLQSSAYSTWYTQAMEQLVGVVQELSQARDLDAVTSVVRQAARNLTGADGASFILREGDQCYYAEENAIAPLWKGRRFPMSTCLSGWVMLNARSTVIEDIYSDSRIPVEAYRPTFVKSLAMVPIRRNSPVGAIGNYWAHQRLPGQEEVAILQALADTTSVALENVELYGKLQRQVHVLEEQQMRIQDQHEALEVFTRALAHDLKEPVRTMICFSSIVSEGKASAAKQQTYLKYIESAAIRMDLLIDTVSRYAGLDDLRIITSEPCVMSSIVDSVKENLATLIQERGAILRVGTLPEVLAHPMHMMQVVQDLVANAAFHNQNKVTIEISAQGTADCWLFFIKDDGKGIPPEQLEKIFLPFKRLTYSDDCTGLGLAICRRIISAYGGTIRCESAPGKGATFIFTLPKPHAD